MTVHDARISVGLPAHPKTKRLIRRLGAAGAWYLVRLFLWVAANRPDGDLAGISDEDLELAVDWPGEPGELIAALESVRFLDGEEGKRSVHGWAEHNPWSSGAADREFKARWNAIKRHHGETEADRLVPEYAARRTATAVQKDASSMPPAQTQHAKGNAPSPSPSPSPSPTSKDCASRKRAANSHGERLPDDQPTPELIAWAETARPDLDVRTEAESFRDYWRAQPGAKGRKSDWPATWRNWIRRANRSNAGTAGPPRGKYGGPMTLPERQAAAMADYYAKHAKTVNAKEGTNGRNGDGAVLGTDDGDLRGALVIDLRPSAGGRVPAGVGADVVPDDSGADQPIPADLPF